MSIYGITLFGYQIGVFIAGPAEIDPAPEEHFDGYEYRCYTCAETLVRREAPLADVDLELLIDAHDCEEECA